MLMQGADDQMDASRPPAAFGSDRGIGADAQGELAMRAAAEFEDFQLAEGVFLRERAERPYADVVARKLALLDTYVQRLRQLAGSTVEAYTTDWMLQCAVERTLELAIDAGISMTRHAIAEQRLRTPATLADVFVIARDAGLLAPELSASLVRMCGFRNRLVHDGQHLDPVLVVGILRTRVDDLVQLGSVARNWMTS